MSIYDAPMNHNGFLRKRKLNTIEMLDQEIKKVYEKIDRLEAQYQMLHELREVKKGARTFESILIDI